MKTFLLILIVSCSTVIYAQDINILRSDYLPDNDTVMIYMPEDYSCNDKIPLVFLLHGWQGNYLQWQSVTDLNSLANKYNCMIVCPDGFNDSWYINSEITENMQYESFFIKDLYDYIVKAYSIDKNKVYISGLSMGGYGSLNIYFNNFELFDAAGCLSGVIKPKHHYKKYGINKRMGNINSNYYSRNSFFKYNFTDDKLDIYLDCGLSDPFCKENINFYEYCKNNNQEVIFYKEEGSHTKDYWRKAIIRNFNYFFKTKENEVL